MKKFWIAFLVLAAVLVGGFAWMASLVKNLEGAGSVATRGGTLHWVVESEYPEERDTEPMALVLEGQRPVMRDVVFALARAARDSRITGLFLEIRALPVDWAKVQELRDGVAAFAASGKPVAAYLEGYGQKEYALALAAGRIIMPPEGNLFILGVSAELSFLKGTLDKLGIQADFVHVGRYKSAPEQLTRNAPSDPHREMIEAIVDDHYERLVGLVAAGRQVDEERARDWIDVGMFDAGQALAAGLVDTVLSLTEAEDQFFPDEDFVALEDYALARRRGRSAGAVALIHVSGTIMPGESSFDGWTGRSAGSETVVQQLRGAGEDDAVQAVLLRVDSPGGSALASDLIWREVAHVRQRKPVIVSMSGYAASGGYYVSCGADSIFAEPGTLTGSIGVFAGKVDMSGFYDKIGISREYITRGENALLFGNNAVFTAAQRQALEEMLGEFYTRFVERVASGRHLTPEQVGQLAEGRVWTGAQAVERGLVDGLGGLTRALAAAKRMIGVAPDELVSVVTYEEQLDFLERLLVRLLRRSGAGAGITAWAPPRTLAAAVARDGTLAVVPLLDGRPLALLPLRLDLR